MSNLWLVWKSSQPHLHLSHSWSPVSSGPRGAQVQPRCQTRCYRWSWTPPCLPYLHTDKVRKQRAGNGNERERVGNEVGSIVNQRGTKTADRAFSIFDDKPKNKRRWKGEDTQSGWFTSLRLPSLTISPQGSLCSSPHPQVMSSPSILHILFTLILLSGYSHAGLPWRATIRLAMQSGTLVPAARKVMPMITSGIPSVKPITVTWNGERQTNAAYSHFQIFCYTAVYLQGTHNYVPASLLMLHSDDYVNKHQHVSVKWA